MAERIVIAGAGALGCVYGGLLEAAGADVVLLARGAHAEALRERGLELRMPLGPQTVPVRVEEEAEADFLLLTAKAFDTESVLARVHGEPSLAVSFQNGLTKNDVLLERYGPGVVVGGASMIAAQLPEPGVAHCTNPGATFVGELGGGTSPRTERLGELLRESGLESHVVEDIDSVEWTKLAQVGSIMAVQALTRRYVHEVMLSPDSGAVMKRMIREVATIAAADQVELRDWPGLLPLRAVLDAEGPEAYDFLRAAGERLQAAGATTYRTSMLQSIEAGKPTELEEIHGALVRRAAERGLDVPVLETCYRLAHLAGA